MSKKRPGVEAAIALCKSRDENRWLAYFEGHADVIGHMSKLEAAAQELAKELQNGSKTSLSRKELLEIIIPWKFAVGKARNALLGQLRSNTDAAVRQATMSGISLAKGIVRSEAVPSKKLQESIEAITVLRGVGPATASVILSMIRPDIFCYMYDEVIDCFLPKRTYTLKIYLECQKNCKKYGDEMKWSPEKVARTLWIAARTKAIMGKDLITNVSTSSNSKRKVKATTSQPGDNKTISAESKRRRNRR